MPRPLCPFVLAITLATAAWSGGLGQEAGKPAPAATGESADDSLPPGVVARIDGRDITIREYGDYLLASLGKSRLGEYIDRLLVEAEARKAGIEATPEEVEKLVEERIDRTIKGLFQGERDKYVAALDRRETTLDDESARLRQEIFYDLLLDRLVLARREVTEEAIRAEFERLYGEGGVELDLRHILIATTRRMGANGELLPPRSEAEARERGEKVHEELLAGADFVQLVKRYSEDTLTSQNDGRIPIYRKGELGDEFDRAVAHLTEEQPRSGVVRSRRGFHLIELVGRRVTRLEDVRAQVEQSVRQRPPSRDEKQAEIRRLRAAAQVVR